MININNMTVSFEPEDLKIRCADAGQYCTTELPCRRCPFGHESVSLDYLIYKFTVLLAKEVNKNETE